MSASGAYSGTDIPKSLRDLAEWHSLKAHWSLSAAELNRRWTPDLDQDITPHEDDAAFHAGCAELLEAHAGAIQADTAALVALMSKVADHLDCCPEDSIEEALANEIREALAKYGKGAL